MSSTFDSLISEARAHTAERNGWDFSYLENRRHGEITPWSYEDQVIQLLEGVERMLDMDTGGSERLSSLYQIRTWQTYKKQWEMLAGKHLLQSNPSLNNVALPRRC